MEIPECTFKNGASTFKNGVITAWKPVSQSPNEHLALLKKHLGISGKACPTGRLDPMAKGVMIYLVGDKTKESDRYMFNTTKIYEFDIVCGFSTDSCDCMGSVTDSNTDYPEDNYATMIDNIRSGKYMEYVQTTPSCSAYKARSKITGEKHPLWMWKHLGRLDEVDIPQTDIKLNRLDILSETTISLGRYIDTITHDISNVTSFNTGNLRGIIDQWIDIKEKSPDTLLKIIRCEAEVPSGTYIRFLADTIGKDAGIPSHAYDITRTKIFL
jgi:tRNA pseudouridine(55) synthase